MRCERRVASRRDERHESNWKPEPPERRNAKALMMPSRVRRRFLGGALKRRLLPGQGRVRNTGVKPKTPNEMQKKGPGTPARRKNLGRPTTG